MVRDKHNARDKRVRALVRLHSISHTFTRTGRFPNLENLKAAAEEAGLEVDKAVAFTTDPEKQAAVGAEARAYSQKGLSGVPTFFINGQMAFSGAQPPQAFVKAFKQLA